MNKNLQKVIFYSDTPLYGGAERQMQLLAENLSKNFQPIFLIRQTEALKDWAESLEKKGFTVYLCPSKSKHSLSNWKYLKEAIKTEKPALIHAHIWNPVSCKYVFWAKKVFQIPLIITEHDPFKLPLAKRIYKKWSLKYADKIITVSKANQDLMTELYPNVQNKITTIHNGISLDGTILSTEQKKRIRKSIFNLSEHNQILLGVGTLHERKGYKYLIKAFQKIHSKKPSTRLILVGEGPERSNLETLISNLGLVNKVLLLGHRADIAELMQSADIFILPSLKEAFGLVILEAFRAGIPVVASDVGGIPEIIVDQKNGILVKPANRFALEKSIEKLLRHPKLAQELSKNAKISLKDFTATKMAKTTEEIYKSSLKNQ